MPRFSFVLSGTMEDAHGETLTKAELEGILASMPATAVLHHHHDMSLPVVGKWANARLEPDADNPGHWVLVADGEVPEGVDPSELGKGFSIAFTAGITRNSDRPTLALYLPFPAYNDQELIDELVNEFPDVAVGKSVKKEVNLALVGLIVTSVCFVLRPLWQHTYDELIRPHWQRALDGAKAFGRRGLRTDVRSLVQLPGRDEVRVHLIPERGNELATLEHDLWQRLLQDLEAQLTAHEAGGGRWPERVIAVYDPKRTGYHICQMTFEDGESLFLG